eukprot:maker-scaffold702_size109376-snap-gene-0.21 protein:Tk12090 transcript:maker-scaffold702_size109376-snap-gene-0.21-mRNA-1 annotation:"mitochondrial import inner membrane translocase subunit tim8"
MSGHGIIHVNKPAEHDGLAIFVRITMGWFGSSTADTTASNKPSSDSLDLSNSLGDSGFDSKKRSIYDDSTPLSAEFGGGSESLGSSQLEAQIQMEQQKLQLMTAIHKINDICWDTCIDTPGSSLSGRNETCLKNCTGRFVDVTLLVTNRFGQLAQKMQGGMR